MCYGAFQLLCCVCAAFTNEREISANGNRGTLTMASSSKLKFLFFFIFHNFQPMCLCQPLCFLTRKGQNGSLKDI